MMTMMEMMTTTMTKTTKMMRTRSRKRRSASTKFLQNMTIPLEYFLTMRQHGVWVIYLSFMYACVCVFFVLALVGHLSIVHVYGVEISVHTSVFRLECLSLSVCVYTYILCMGLWIFKYIYIYIYIYISIYAGILKESNLSIGFWPNVLFCLARRLCSMYVCICVCMYVCMYLCMYVCLTRRLCSLSQKINVTEMIMCMCQKCPKRFMTCKCLYVRVCMCICMYIYI